MFHINRLVVALAVFGTFAGCSKKDSEGSKSAPLTKEKAAAPAKQALTAAWFGKAVALPGVLAKVKIGGAYDEALKAAGADSSGDLPESEFEGVRYGISKDNNVVTEVNLWLPQAMKPRLVEAWGEGKEITSKNSVTTAWFNPETGIRATYSNQSSGDDAYLRFERYLPLAKFLGEGKQIAVLAQPLIGLTPDAAAKAYPEYPYRNGLSLTLPPTEWELGETDLVWYSPSGTIESVSFQISYKGRPEAKNEILAAIKAKWGEPKGEDKDSNAAIYNEADPRIVVDEKCSTCRDEIEIEISK